MLPHCTAVAVLVQMHVTITYIRALCRRAKSSLEGSGITLVVDAGSHGTCSEPQIPALGAAAAAAAASAGTGVQQGTEVAASRTSISSQPLLRLRHSSS